MGGMAREMRVWKRSVVLNRYAVGGGYGAGDGSGGSRLREAGQMEAVAEG